MQRQPSETFGTQASDRVLVRTSDGRAQAWFDRTLTGIRVDFSQLDSYKAGRYFRDLLFLNEREIIELNTDLTNVYTKLAEIDRAYTDRQTGQLDFRAMSNQAYENRKSLVSYRNSLYEKFHIKCPHTGDGICEDLWRDNCIGSSLLILWQTTLGKYGLIGNASFYCGMAKISPACCQPFRSEETLYERVVERTGRRNVGDLEKGLTSAGGASAGGAVATAPGPQGGIAANGGSTYDFKETPMTIRVTAPSVASSMIESMTARA